MQRSARQGNAGAPQRQSLLLSVRASSHRQTRAPRKDGTKLQPDDPTTHGNPDGTWHGQDVAGRPVQLCWWQHMHVKDARWLDLTVIQVVRPLPPTASVILV